MYRNFISPYYPPYSGYQYLPYNFHQGYFYMPYNNYINSNVANSNQRLYNYGTMSDVYQQSYIMQSSSGVSGMCTSATADPEQTIDSVEPIT